METFLKVVAWVNDNRSWLLPLVAVGVIAIAIRETKAGVLGLVDDLKGLRR